MIDDIKKSYIRINKINKPNPINRRKIVYDLNQGNYKMNNSNNGSDRWNFSNRINYNDHKVKSIHVEDDVGRN